MPDKVKRGKGTSLGGNGRKGTGVGGGERKMAIRDRSSGRNKYTGIYSNSAQRKKKGNLEGNEWSKKREKE